MTNQLARDGHDALVATLIPEIKKIAGKMAKRLPPSVEIDDLTGAAYVALIESLPRLNPASPETWVPYLKIRAQGAMIDYLRATDPVRRFVHKRARRLREARTAIEQSTRQPATREQVAAQLEIKLSELDAFELSAIEQRTLSLETPLDHHADGATIGDTLRDERDIALTTFQDRVIEQTLQHIPPREAQIIRLYLEGKTLREIGIDLGVTESRISQLIGRGIRRVETLCGDPPYQPQSLPITANKETPQPTHTPIVTPAKQHDCTEPAPRKAIDETSLRNRLYACRAVIRLSSDADRLLSKNSRHRAQLSVILLGRSAPLP